MSLAAAAAAAIEQNCFARELLAGATSLVQCNWQSVDRVLAAALEIKSVSARDHEAATAAA